ncbi:unnamed protein product [Caenorhabditis auriculariae]|uniref:Aminotransferase class V domain-containing protein n=1 Tax=Caenorhabditis auriculariae TaxID=2777116 RepID=A0A8S1HN15_9PELO|nr:unnamed protein product [Caenorhabditis auriculariae]
MQGFKLSSGPVDERYRYLFEKRRGDDDLKGAFPMERREGSSNSYRQSLDPLNPPKDIDDEPDRKRHKGKRRRNGEGVKRLAAKLDFLVRILEIHLRRVLGKSRHDSLWNFNLPIFLNEILTFENCLRNNLFLIFYIARSFLMEERRFGEQIPASDVVQTPNSEDDVGNLLEWMRNDEIGHDATLESPFGDRQIVYCDYTASARAFKSIENYIQTEVLPFYGNTHSSVTVTAEQTTLFMHEARQEIRAMTGAGDLDDKPLVVVHSIHEHHSNLLPWRHRAEKCYVVDEQENGDVDLESLERNLKLAVENHAEALIVGAFTACSNVTGVLINVENVTKTLKKFGALSVWDYASAAPYVEIQVNGRFPLDAVFFSGHKFPGGVSSPGVLVVKKAIGQVSKPQRIGGGTVFFVSRAGEWYLKEAEHREEGGTADPVGAVRLAMAVKLKRSVGERNIGRFEENLSRIFLGEIAFPFFSFVVKDLKSGLFFHHNYISALLNDLFGIQTRAGCMCAGPYVQHLLGIDEKMSSEYLEALREIPNLDRTHLRRTREYSQHEFLRPGFTRISFPYYFTAEKVRQVAECVKFVAEHAADLIHLYQVNCESSEWHHKNQRVFHDRRWLGHTRFTKDGLIVKEAKKRERAPSMKELLEEAEILAEEFFDFLRMWERFPTAELLSNQSFPTSDEIEHITEDFEEIPSENQENGEKEFTCPLSLEEQTRGRGIDGDIECDEKLKQEVKTAEDWGRRVVVKPVALTRQEESQLEWHAPPIDMYKKVTEVIHELKMIKEGDRILVCLSGGKDSLSLLHILHFYQMRCRKNRSTKFDLGAITVDPGSAEYNPRPLIEYCKKLNIHYFYEEQVLWSHEE